jgi:hypothetical protein
MSQAKFSTVLIHSWLFSVSVTHRNILYVIFHCIIKTMILNTDRESYVITFQGKYAISIKCILKDKNSEHVLYFNYLGCDK